MGKESKLDVEAIFSKMFPESINNSVERNAFHKIDIQLDNGRKYFATFFHGTSDSHTIIYFPSTIYDDDIEKTAEAFLEKGINFSAISLWDAKEKVVKFQSVDQVVNDLDEIFLAIFNYLKNKNYSGDIFVMGSSFGSVCAINTTVVHKDKIKGLVLESVIGKTAPFLSAIGVDKQNLEFDNEKGFNQLGNIAHIDIPTLFLQGAKDQFVSIAEAEKMQVESGARTKQFFLIPGADHTSVRAAGGELYFETIKKFINTVTGENTWRHRRKKTKAPFK